MRLPKGISYTGCFFSEDEGKGHPATSRKASFSLPDQTVGFGFAPNQLCARGLLPPVEYIRFRRKLSPLIYHHFMARSMISYNFLFFLALVRQNRLKCGVRRRKIEQTRESRLLDSISFQVNLSVRHFLLPMPRPLPLPRLL